MTDEQELRAEVVRLTEKIDNLCGYVDELSSILGHHRESIEHLDTSVQMLADHFEASD
jgi:hypothetical protein